jgi:uncharacterized protein (TIGR00299 family) protein
MRTIFIECNMGAAGDMLMSALSEIIDTSDIFIDEMNNLGLENVVFTREKVQKCGVFGTHISVKVSGEEEHSHDINQNEHEHHHHEHHHKHHHEHAHHHHSHAIGMSEIAEIINALPVSAKVKSDAIAVYRIIAEAEAKVHGKTADSVHFHEVGTFDAIADIIGVCKLIEQIAPEKIVVSPINTGFGQVQCAHGILPVPAPATAEILTGIPTYSGNIRGELCTPTGAALLKHFAATFGEKPVMTVEKIGYGMGNKDFSAANCVRVFLGETANDKNEDNEFTDEITEIICNIDDMTGEELGFALEILLENGALDTAVIPCVMKKSRPAQMLLCLCKTADSDKFVRLIMKYTSTFGVRTRTCRRYILDRKTETNETEFGQVRVKCGSGYGTDKRKIEYDDLAAIAKARGVSLSEARKLI